jgi:hypothetical protein
MHSFAHLFHSLRGLSKGKSASRRVTPTLAPRFKPCVNELESRFLLAVSVGTASIQSNFNGTPIAAGSTIWFTSVLKPSGLSTTQPVTLTFTNQQISFTNPSTHVAYSLAVPDATLTFSPTTTVATTTFSGGTWNTSLPSTGLSGNDFLSGFAFTVPSGGLPGGINPVTWSGQMQTTGAKVTVQWQWTAAVYSSFSSDYNALGVKPVDDNHASTYKNSDHAGTPEYFTIPGILPGGARGGGGSNWTGSYSGTQAVVPAPLNTQNNAPATISGTVFDDSGVMPTGLEGIQIVLSGVDANGNAVYRMTTTDMNGNYSFSNVAPGGNYTLTENSLATGYFADFASAGTVNNQTDGSVDTVSYETIGGISLNGGDAGVNYDFYQRPVMVIG